MLTKLHLETPTLINSVEFIETNTVYQTYVSGLNLKIQWVDFNKYGTYRASSVKSNIKKEFVREWPCAKPFNEFTIYYDGVVVPCCEVFHDQNISKFIISEIKTDTIFDAYASSKMARFRQSTFVYGSKNGICEKCTVHDYSNGSDKRVRHRILKNLENSPI